MNRSAFELEMVFKDLIQMEKEKTNDELSEQMMLMKIVESKKSSWLVEIDRIQRRAKRSSSTKASRIKFFSKNALYIDTRRAPCGYDSDASDKTATV